MFGFGKKAPARRTINRDPNNQLNFNGVSIQDQGGFASSRLAISGRGPVAQRGAVARAALAYDRMTKLGGGAAAGQLQKSAFAKLKKASGASAQRDFNLYK